MAAVPQRFSIHETSSLRVSAMGSADVDYAVRIDLMHQDRLLLPVLLTYPVISLDNAKAVNP